jgi:hypothetical protein
LTVVLRLLATAFASVVLFAEQARQSKAAIAQAAELQKWLLAELQVPETKFQRFSERSDVAIFTINPAGQCIYRNQCWYNIF